MTFLCLTYGLQLILDNRNVVDFKCLELVTINLVRPKS